MKGADVFPVLVPADIQRRRLVLFSSGSGSGGWGRGGGSILRLVRFLSLLLFLLLGRGRGGWGCRRGRRVVVGEWRGWWWSQDLDWLSGRAGIRVGGRGHGVGGEAEFKESFREASGR